MTFERRIYDLAGIVQGVGFRPSLKRLANEATLGGWIQNRSGRVRLALEGERGEIDHFLEHLQGRLPPNASIENFTLLESETVEQDKTTTHFEILSSEGGDDQEVVIPADLAICADCAEEIMDPSDRRYGYPFTTCTACGPRYTVVDNMPYDRERTTLKHFTLCDHCRREYETEKDRRFHAESIACPDCGPQIWIEKPSGEHIDANVLKTARKSLSEGSILAVRGIGGFLLAVDPFNRQAVQRLRQLKKRPHKPFAIMARDIETLRKYTKVDAESLELMNSTIAPIMIVAARAGTKLDRETINPDSDTIGAMLPTTPLHMLLFEPLEGDPTHPFELLIMTSGNRGGEPICISNAEARERLAGIADLYLFHNREINLRNDDSIFAIRSGKPQVWRRARGCAPNTVPLKRSLDRPVLAMGPELKNTIAMGRDKKVTLSPHVGDLDTPEAVAGLERVARELPAFLRIEPATIAVDLHPDMQSTLLGERLAKELSVPLTRVQHHHAHAAGCLAEHGLDTGLALVMDGTGFGEDGTIWGAELLEIEPGSCRRRAGFESVPLPGGDAATVRPPRQLAARFIHSDIAMPQWLRSNLGIEEHELDTWRLQIENNINTPYTSAAGRLFDSFSALLGYSNGPTTYDAQAAIRLEAAAGRAKPDNSLHVPYRSSSENGILRIDWSPALQKLARKELTDGKQDAWALAFHHSIANAAMEMIDYGLSFIKTSNIALSGGVFMNRMLNDILVQQLSAKGLNPIIHRNIPTNDGGIAFGQVVIAGLMTEG